jgi:uncharacterized protein DUF928
MKLSSLIICCLAAVFILAVASPLLAAEANLPVYKLPTRGAPGGRVGGGTRGDTNVYNLPTRGAPGGRVGGGTRGDTNVFILSALAPDHSGLTTSEQPSLYWYISDSISLPIELTVIDSKNVEPLLETQLPAPGKGGIQQVRLADYKIHLTPGEAYRWFIAVVPDPNRRSKDILAGGAIERIDTPQEIKAKLASSENSQKQFIYAEAGIWYDALQSISDLIDASPQNAELRQQRTALLTQVGLPSTNE